MLKQYVLLLSARGFGSLLNALAFIIVARVLPVDEVGRLGAITGILTFVFLVADLGMSAYIPRQWVRGDKAAAEGGLVLNFQSSLLFGSVSLSALGLLAFIDSIGPLGWAYTALAFGLAVEKNTDTALSLAVAERRAAVPVVSVILRRLVTVSILLGLMALEVNPLLAFTIGVAAGGVAGQVHFRLWRGTRLPRAVHPSSSRKTLRSAIPFWLANVSSSARALDVTLVSLTAGASTAGLYSAASRLVSPFALIPAALTEIIVPHSARMNRAGATRLGSRLVFAAAATFVVCAVAAALSGQIVNVLLGDRFAGAVPVLAVLLLGLPFVALSSPLGSVLQGQGREALVARNGIVFAFVLLALIVLGSALFGGLGSAVAVGITYILKCVVLYLALRRHSGE